jgi:hypothetical protein
MTSYSFMTKPLIFGSFERPWMQEKFPMKFTTPLLLFLLFLVLFPAWATADCVADQYGRTVCGEGQCATDVYGKVFCADAGGGAIRDKFGKVLCGRGSCAKDYLEQVWCSKEPGGGAAVDTFGKVKCLGGCEPGSSASCREGR